jgi:hypothetical protein
VAVVIKGYLTETKLAGALKQVMGSGWGGSQLLVEGTRKRWDMWFIADGHKVVVEFDGDEHYRSTLKIKTDREKDAIAAAHGIRVVRIPYWVQLDGVTFRHFFGFDAEVERDFPHGFIVTKTFPASFCEMGLVRFEDELGRLPEDVRAEVVKSLRDRAAEHGIEYVLPSRLKGLVG